MIAEKNGEGGIRTPGAPKGSADFKSAAFSRSATSPKSLHYNHFKAHNLCQDEWLYNRLYNPYTIRVTEQELPDTATKSGATNE